MKRIGKYEICGMLGRGGMGQVYKARVPEIGAMVALKLLRPVDHLQDVLDMAELERRFLHEARTMAAIDHPNIARVWDFDRHEGLPFFVMEYACENLGAAIGESYRVEEPTRRIWPDKAMSYVLQTLDALGRLHAEGVVHRDIKPYNLLLTSDESIRLIDFGLSRLRGEQTPTGPATMKVGTPYYTSPEQEADPEAADGRADLFSVGVLLFRLLTGLLPPDGGIQDGAPVFAETSPPAGMERDWEAFFRKALAPAPDRRFASAEAMATALHSLYEAWQGALDSVCHLDDEDLETFCPVPEGNAASGKLRSTPQKTGPIAVSEAFTLDSLGRPLTGGVRFLEMDSNADAPLLHAPSSGLAWQREGSRWPCTWQRAHEYIQDLNARHYGGRDNWRLPTVEELATLITPPEETHTFCLPGLFSTRQRLLWSADRRSYVAAWHLNAGLGFIGWQDFTCPAWVRAVSNKE